MNSLLTKAIAGKPVTDFDIADALFEICDNVHSSCYSACPVYAANGHAVPDTAHDFKKNRGCDCFKNGAAMLAFLRSHP